MDLGYIDIRLGGVMKDFGLMICRMVMGFRNGLMVHTMKDSLKMVSNMVKVLINGMMEVIIKEIGRIIL